MPLQAGRAVTATVAAGCRQGLLSALSSSWSKANTAGAGETARGGLGVAFMARLLTISLKALP